MWVIGEYEATSLFSLKSNLATSSAGKSLLVPTPYALKMALLDAAIRTRGLNQGKQAFNWLKEMDVAIAPAEKAVVTNLFAKIQKPRRNDGKKKDIVTEDLTSEVEEEGDNTGPFGPTIAYREYVYYQGSIGFAFSPKSGIFEEEALNLLPELLLQLNYLGKRGGFIQIVSLPQSVATLSNKYVTLTGNSGSFLYQGILQSLDDCGPELTFEKADIFSDKAIRLGKDRISRPVIVPYELKRSSRSYSFYQLQL